MITSPSASSRLRQLLGQWSGDLAVHTADSPHAQPPLVPHLAAAADFLLQDTFHTLNLANIPVTRELVRARAAIIAPPSPQDPWPAPDPVARIKSPTPRGYLPGEIDPVALASLDGYLACQQEFKHTVMRLLQGATLSSVFPQDLTLWYLTLMEPWAQTGLIPTLDLRQGRSTTRSVFPIAHTPPHPAEIASCLDVLLGTKGLRQHPVLAHLGLLWIQPWTRGNGRMARLVQSALMIGSGRPWSVIPGTQREAYLAAIQLAFDKGEASPLTDLLTIAST